MSTPVEAAAAALRLFASYNDVDGQIRAALDLSAATQRLLVPELLLSARVVEQLLALLQSRRADAQAAAAAAVAAACRFEELQTEWVAQQGVVPLTAVLRLYLQSVDHPIAQRVAQLLSGQSGEA